MSGALAKIIVFFIVSCWKEHSSLRTHYSVLALGEEAA
jgi:hypothetical protein